MLCEKLELFFDGELPPEDAALVRQHTADCSRCQRELHAMMQLQALNLALVEERAQRRDTPVASSRPVGATITPLRPRIYRTVLAASVAVAAAAAALLWFRQDRAAGPELASITPLPGLGSTRAIEGRLSYGGADLYRPYEVQRASGTAVEHGIPLAALAKLEERGDVHGIAAAHLLMGSRSQAEHYLDSAHNEPALAVDVESDRALLALLDSDPENALQILDRALEQEPQHPQALWNRALALRDLGLPLLAAEAFERVTALNEPGWYQEARAQAERLRRTASEQEAAWDIVLARSRAFARTGAGVSVRRCRAPARAGAQLLLRRRARGPHARAARRAAADRERAGRGRRGACTRRSSRPREPQRSRPAPWPEPGLCRADRSRPASAQGRTCAGRGRARRRDCRHRARRHAPYRRSQASGRRGSPARVPGAGQRQRRSVVRAARSRGGGAGAHRARRLCGRRARPRPGLAHLRERAHRVPLHPDRLLARRCVRGPAPRERCAPPPHGCLGHGAARG